MEYGRSTRLPLFSTPSVAYWPGTNLNSPPLRMRNIHKIGSELDTLGDMRVKKLFVWNRHHLSLSSNFLSKLPRASNNWTAYDPK